MTDTERVINVNDLIEYLIRTKCARCARHGNTYSRTDCIGCDVWDEIDDIEAFLAELRGGKAYV